MAKSCLGYALNRHKSGDRKRQKDIFRRMLNLTIQRKECAAVALICSVAFLLAFSLSGEAARTAPPFIKQIDRLAERAGLGLQTVSLTGFNATSDDEIFAALGLENSHTLLTFDANRARQQLEVLPWVQAAQIKQTFPHRLDVSIRERRPHALWVSPHGEILIDHEGRQLAVVRAGAVRNLPIVEGEGAAQTANILFDRLSYYPELNPLSVRAVRVDTRRWTLVLADGRHVLLPEERVSEALAVLMDGPEGQRLLDQDFAVVDLRVAGHVVLRLPHATATHRYSMSHQRASKG